MAAVVVVLLMAVGGSWQAKSVDDAVIGKPNLMWKSGYHHRIFTFVVYISPMIALLMLISAERLNPASITHF